MVNATRKTDFLRSRIGWSAFSRARDGNSDQEKLHSLILVRKRMRQSANLTIFRLSPGENYTLI